MAPFEGRVIIKWNINIGSMWCLNTTHCVAVSIIPALLVTGMQPQPNHRAQSFYFLRSESAILEHSAIFPVHLDFEGLDFSTVSKH